MRKPIALSLLLLAAAVIPVLACGSDPKPPPTPTAPTTPPIASTPTTAPAVADAGPAAAADAGSDGGKSEAQLKCDALIEDANSTLDGVRIKVDTVCKKDADCMPIKGRACSFVCQNGAIPKGEEKEWTAALNKVKDGACKKWSDADCVKVTPNRAPPTCAGADKKPSCQAGHCALK